MLYGNHTPWGKCDYCEEIVDGVYFVGTPSHGGVVVAKHDLIMRLSPYARKQAIRECNCYWFEEDCGWALPIHDLNLYKAYAESYHKPDVTEEIVRGWVKHTLTHWHKEYKTAL